MQTTQMPYGHNVEPAGGDGSEAVSVTQDADGTVTITNARGQSYSFQAAEDAELLARVAQLHGAVAGAGMSDAAPAGLTLEPVHTETSARALNTLVGDPGHDRLVQGSAQPQLYGGRFDNDLPPALRNEIPLWAIQGHMAWLQRARSLSWQRRRRLMRLVWQLRRVAKARRKTRPTRDWIDPSL